MQRIRDYSTGQLDRVHENYIFQRQRLRKFSAQNYLRVRATGKSTQRTLNKVMESLPPLYLDFSTCRQGLGAGGSIADRQESINFPPDFTVRYKSLLNFEQLQKCNFCYSWPIWSHSTHLSWMLTWPCVC